MVVIYLVNRLVSKCLSWSRLIRLSFILDSRIEPSFFPYLTEKKKTWAFSMKNSSESKYFQVCFHLVTIVASSL